MLLNVCLAGATGRAGSELARAIAPLRMRGGTVFHFVTDGIHAALQPARDAAGGPGIQVIGGVSTGQHLQAALLDELQLTLAPVLLAIGEFIVPIFSRFR